MHPIVGVALSLLLSEPHNGSNGFDPTSLYLVLQGTRILVSSGQSSEFLAWLKEDQARREPVVRYFVACAFGPETVLELDTPGTPKWKGALGLAPSLKDLRSVLARRPGAGMRLTFPPVDGRWISACLMALSNVKTSHEYVSLRGNPPAWTKAPTAAELWTMGYPEGVFFADVLNFNMQEQSGDSLAKGPLATPTKVDLERSYTLSLNLPQAYPSQPPYQWAPPNASIGRTLDFAKATIGESPPVGAYRVAEKLGTFQAYRHLFRRAATPADPDYAPDLVCLAPKTAGEASPSTRPHALQDGPSRQVVDCSSAGAEQLRPLFVHAPRVASLSAASNTVDPSLIIQTLDTGPRALGGSVEQKPPCAAGVDCTGPVVLIAAGQIPVAPDPPLPSRTLARLAEGQSVTVVLRYDEANRYGKLDENEQFTAIVRYRSPTDAVARVEVSAHGKGWRPPTTLWPGTGGAWQWLQVYPVQLQEDLPGSRRPSLKLRITGLGTGESAPTLDVAGFVSGPPWCREDPSGEFAGICDKKAQRVSLLRRYVPMKK